jgi:hypothetical protein
LENPQHKRIAPEMQTTTSTGGRSKHSIVGQGEQTRRGSASNGYARMQRAERTLPLIPMFVTRAR